MKQEIEQAIEKSTKTLSEQQAQLAIAEGRLSEVQLNFTLLPKKTRELTLGICRKSDERQEKELVALADKYVKLDFLEKVWNYAKITIESEVGHAKMQVSSDKLDLERHITALTDYEKRKADYKLIAEKIRNIDTTSLSATDVENINKARVQKIELEQAARRCDMAKDCQQFLAELEGTGK